MAGLSSIIHSALRTMEAATSTLAVASNNIANEKTPGYAKQRLVVQPAGSPGDGRILIGSGVEVVGIEAVRDRLLEGRLRSEVSSKAGDDALYSTLQNIEILFNDAAETGMLPSLTNYFNSFHALALDPSSINYREQVRIAAEDLALDFKTRGEELRRVQSVADKQIAEDITQINSLADRIGLISKEIRVQEAGGQVANDLRDRRGTLVKEIAEYIDVKETNSSNSFQLSIANTMLVYDTNVAAVTADASGAGGFVSVKIGPADVGKAATAGRIFAHQEVRDKYVPDYLNKLDQLAYEVAQQVNAIHSVGYDRSGNTGVNFFDPLASATDAARQIKVSSAITADLSKIATAKQSSGNDNEAATDIGNLLHKQVFTGGSVIDQYRALVFSLGNDTTRAQDQLDEHTALLHQLENRRDSISGVSIDEETMKILQFQRAYQASASVIRVIDELMQTILTIGAR